MPEPTTYRLVTPKDKEALETLITATADSGDIGFTDEYQADLLAIHRGLAEEFHAAVAEIDGEVIGMVFGEVRWVQYAGQEVPGVYISHLRVHPDYRQQGVARELSDWALEYITDLLRSDAVLYGAIMAKNVSFKLGNRYGFKATKLVQGGIVPMRKSPPTAIPDLEVRVAERNELPAIVEGMNAFYRVHNHRCNTDCFASLRVDKCCGGFAVIIHAQGAMTDRTACRGDNTVHKTTVRFSDNEKPFGASIRLDL